MHIIDSEEKLYLFDHLGPSPMNAKEDPDPIGIDSEWRPTLNVFH